MSLIITRKHIGARLKSDNASEGIFEGVTYCESLSPNIYRGKLCSTYAEKLCEQIKILNS